MIRCVHCHPYKRCLDENIIGTIVCVCVCVSVAFRRGKKPYVVVDLVSERSPSMICSWLHFAPIQKPNESLPKKELQHPDHSMCMCKGKKCFVYNVSDMLGLVECQALYTHYQHVNVLMSDGSPPPLLVRP